MSDEWELFGENDLEGQRRAASRSGLPLAVYQMAAALERHAPARWRDCRDNGASIDAHFFQALGWRVA